MNADITTQVLSLPPGQGNIGKWPIVPLGEIISPISREERLVPSKSYKLLGAQWYAKGLYVKAEKLGSQIRAEKLYRVIAGDFVYNRLFAWKGSFAVASKEEDGAYVSGEFPCFEVKPDRLDARYLWYFFSRKSAWNEALGLSTGGTPTSRNRLKEEKFLAMRILLPPLHEQRRMVAYFEKIAGKVTEAHSIRNRAFAEASSLVTSKIKNVIAKYHSSTRKIPFTDIAKLQRRPVKVEVDQRYQEIGVYCFGNGIFHKAPRTGAEVGNKDLYRIKVSDLILQVTFAWEGAVALASEAEDGLYGSTRYLTYEVNEQICSRHYLLAYLKTPEVIAHLDRISPGSAGRNRVLNIKRLSEILIPIIPLEAQSNFGKLVYAIDSGLKHIQSETGAELNALLPSVVYKAFSDHHSSKLDPKGEAHESKGFCDGVIG